MNIKRSVRSDINIKVETNEGDKMGHGRGPKDKPCDLKDNHPTPENDIDILFHLKDILQNNRVQCIIHLNYLYQIIIYSYNTRFCSL